MNPVALAHEASDAGTFERAVLDRLKREIGFDAAFFVAKGASPTTVRVDAHALTRALVEDRYQAELGPVKRAALARRNVAVDTDVLGEPTVREAAYHRDFARSVGGRHSLMGYLSLRGRPFGALMLGRAGSSFTPSEIARVEALLPALAVARSSFGVSLATAPLPTSPPRSPARRLVDAVRGERVVAVVDTPGGSLLVRDRAEHREMVERRDGRELVWTRVRLDDASRSGWFYIQLFHLAASLAASRTRALFLGCGGAVALHQFARAYPGIEMDVVEPDPRVIDLARAHFGLASIPGVTTHLAEGLSFLSRAPEARWDVVVVDAYDGCALPDGFADRRFFAGLRAALAPGGAFAFNVVGALRGEGPVCAVERAARAELDQVRLVPVLDPGERFDGDARRNVVVVGVRG
jgi:SAM-dependent methyltransferase